MMHKDAHNVTPNPSRALTNLPVYSREGYKVLPLCSGFVVIDLKGREISRGKVGDIEGMVELVDELVMKKVA